MFNGLNKKVTVKKITMNWENKVVIITGSSMGIGKSIAANLLQKGAIVILNATNVQRLESTLNEFIRFQNNITLIAGDVANTDDCRTIINTTICLHGRIDVLINNAGISSEGSLKVTDPTVFKRIIDVNLTGAATITHFALPYIIQSKGSILFIGSVAAIHGIGNHSAYCCSKMALSALAQSLRIELENTDVHIAIAYLGFTENSKDKTILNTSGNKVPQPSRTNIKQMPLPVVANKLVNMLEQKKKKMIFSRLGKWVHIINKIAPTLLHTIYKGLYKKQKQKVEFQS